MDKNKEKKKKDEKKKIAPFNQIDITTATEDDIIRSGIKDNTKKDVTCYFIMFIVFVLAVLPVALRLIIPRPVTTEETEIVYFTITCYKTTSRDNYELSTTLVSNYRDGKVNNVSFDFKWFKRNENAKENYSFLEVDELLNMKKNGLTSKGDVNKANVEIDFQGHPELREDEDLKDYTYHSTTEVNVLTNEKGYSCTTDSKTEVEVVDIETREKVK